MKKINNYFDDKEIVKNVFDDDNYYTIRQKIANHIKIHEKYLLLISSNKIIGFQHDYNELSFFYWGSFLAYQVLQL